MAFTLIRLPAEPIVIITIDLPLDRYLSSVRNTNAQLSQWAAETRAVLYFVFDVADQDMAFSDVLIGLDELGGSSSWINYSHVRVVAVGTSPMLRIAKKRLYQQFRIQMEAFASRDEAFDHIRDELDSVDA